MFRPCWPHCVLQGGSGASRFTHGTCIRRKRKNEGPLSSPILIRTLSLVKIKMEGMHGASVAASELTMVLAGRDTAWYKGHLAKLNIMIVSRTPVSALG